jgi:hypothetical protein
MLILLQGGCRDTVVPPAQSAHIMPKPQYTELKTYDDPEAYAVYKALFEEKTENKRVKSESDLAFKIETKAQEACAAHEISSDPRAAEAVSDFSVRNAQPLSLNQNSLKFGRTMQFVSQPELQAVFAKGVGQGWKSFRAKYPNLHGYQEVSAVGFNSDKTFAILYSAVHCGEVCGVGGFTTLRKTQGAWRRDPTRSCSWIS